MALIRIILKQEITALVDAPLITQIRCLRLLRKINLTEQKTPQSVHVTAIAQSGLELAVISKL